MSEKIKALIAVGGTGGHVLPGCNLAEHLNEKNYNIDIVSDKRGYKYLNNFKNFNIHILPSSPLINKNIFTLFFSSILVTYSVLRSLFFLISHRPFIIFGMGGYASFPLCIAASILRIKFVIYENNLIIGKANKYLLPFTSKILVAYKEIEGISQKYHNKVIEIGNIINKKIINISLRDKNFDNQKISILILGGSQAAKIFAEKLPKIFRECSSKGVNLNVYQQCLPDQNDQLFNVYKNYGIEFASFNFTNNLTEYFSKVDIAITRSGSSILAELTNAKIPFISVPLPSSADNHQLKNAMFYQKKKFGFLIEEKDLNDKLSHLIKEIYENNLLLNNIKNNQRQYSDKNVYNNINQALREIIYEKN